MKVEDQSRITEKICKRIIKKTLTTLEYDTLNSPGKVSSGSSIYRKILKYNNFLPENKNIKT